VAAAYPRGAGTDAGLDRRFVGVGRRPLLVLEGTTRTLYEGAVYHKIHDEERTTRFQFHGVLARQGPQSDAQAGSRYSPHTLSRSLGKRFPTAVGFRARSRLPERVSNDYSHAVITSPPAVANPFDPH
jgi:hypothetical protein